MSDWGVSEPSGDDLRSLCLILGGFVYSELVDPELDELVGG